MSKRRKTKKLLIALSKEDQQALKLVQSEFGVVSMSGAVRLSLRYLARFTTNYKFWEWAAEAGFLLPASAHIERTKDAPPIDPLR